MRRQSVIIVCGPTAVGKTALAIQLALFFKTQIISADSRQCFKELNIGVAKPSAEELSAVRHYFINSHHIREDVNAGIFEQYALHAAGEIFEKRAVAIMVGGTGLYIKAFTEGMDKIPSINQVIRQEIIEEYKEKGLEYLQNQVASKDPAFWQIAEQQNPQRLMRALEIVLSTGRSVTTFRQGNKEKRPFNIIKIGLQLPRQQLYDQIDKRVDLMVERGLVEEARELLPERSINALQTVGYRELFEFFDGKVSLPQAVANIKTNTRHYAKRQLTWFKRDEEINWFDANDPVTFQSIIEKISVLRSFR